uniref:Uncharacterized protein n=1 Tax=Anguilla anguilla TaxID=7936 RepID=A0A0E9U3X1_ANGAN
MQVPQHLCQVCLCELGTTSSASQMFFVMS